VTYRLGIDLGGTQIKALAISREGKELSRISAATQDEGVHWKENVRGVVGEIIAAHGAAEHIGIAAPGLAARDEKYIAYMPGRLASLEGLDWSEYLNAACPVRVLNDAHAALLGEVWLGAAQGVRDAFMLTLGTGVGGAILCNGKLLRGHIGRAGHLGHISLDPHGTPDIVNTPGSLEDAIGNCTLALRSGGRFRDSIALLAAVEIGDEDAMKLWDDSVRTLAAAIASCLNVLDPELVVLGGGLINAGDKLFAPLGEYLDAMEWRPGGHRVKIVAAQLGEYAGAYGAARYAGDV